MVLKELIIFKPLSPFPFRKANPPRTEKRTQLQGEEKKKKEDSSIEIVLQKQGALLIFLKSHDYWYFRKSFPQAEDPFLH